MLCNPKLNQGPQNQNLNKFQEYKRLAQIIPNGINIYNCWNRVSPAPVINQRVKQIASKIAITL